MVRIGLAEVLRSAAIRIVGEARDASEGLAAVRSRRPDILILGEHSGPTADVVRQARQGLIAPIVAVLMADASREEIVPVLAAGADGIFERSVAADELVSSMARLLAGERVVSRRMLPVLAGMGPSPAGAPAAPPAYDDPGLTARQREVLARLADGLTNDEIARALYVNPSTVKTHLSQIYAKLGVKTRHEALARAASLGLLS